ncbi:TetR/AcrR family transcriptional regulator [Streptomyces sp. NPDC058171]
MSSGNDGGTGGGRTVSPRRDAVRNRDALLAAARGLFAERGLDVPFDDVARRAGLGSATLYRHFPNRAALVGAVYGDLLDATARAGRRALDESDAWAGLGTYVTAVYAGLAADPGANDLMTTSIPGITALDALHEEHRRTVARLVARAQEQGAMRGDVAVEDLLLTLAAVGRTVPALASLDGAWQRQLALLLDGLRAPAPVPLPGRAPTGDELTDVLHALGPRLGR